MASERVPVTELLERELRVFVGQAMDLTWQEVQGRTKSMPEQVRGYWEPRLRKAIAQAIEDEIDVAREAFRNPDAYPRRSE